MEMDQEANSTLHDCRLLVVPHSLTATIRLHLARSWSKIIFAGFGFCHAKLPINPRETPVIHCNSLALRGEEGLETQRALQSIWMMTLWPLGPWPESSTAGGSAARWTPSGWLLMACFLSFTGVFIEELWASSKNVIPSKDTFWTLKLCLAKKKNIIRISEKAQILIRKYSQRAQLCLVEFYIIPIQFYHYFK